MAPAPIAASVPQGASAASGAEAIGLAGIGRSAKGLSIAALKKRLDELGVPLPLGSME